MFKIVLLVAVAIVSAQASNIFVEKGDPCPEDGELAPSIVCSLYFECVFGEQVEMNCPDDLLFNPREGYCDYPENVPECVGGTRPPEDGTPVPPRTTTTRRPETTVPVSEPAEESSPAPGKVCTEDSIYFQTHPENCELYYFCNHLKETLQECPEGTVFDPKVCNCNLPDYVEGCDAEVPLCQPGESGFKPVAGDCASYIFCLEGVGSVLRCPEGTLFDPIVKQCNRAESVTCLDSVRARPVETCLPVKLATVYKKSFLARH